jgi:hypothetical protein
VTHLRTTDHAGQVQDNDKRKHDQVVDMVAEVSA